MAFAFFAGIAVIKNCLERLWGYCRLETGQGGIPRRVRLVVACLPSS